MNFRRDPLKYIDTRAIEGGEAFWLPDRQLCIRDAGLGRAVFRNQDRLYLGASDFFTGRSGVLAPRKIQIRIGAEARALLEARMEAVDIEHAVDSLDAKTFWPKTGNRLLLEVMFPVLAAETRSRLFKRLLADIVETRICNRKTGLTVLRRMVLRGRFYNAVSRERQRDMASDRAPGAAPPTDILGVITRSTDDRATDEQVMEIFLAFLFAIVGSVGFTLGWSVYLTARYGAAGVSSHDIISEALRLYPIAWFIARRPARAHEIADHPVTKDDTVVVCPYAIHRNPSHWEKPDSFLPERWAGNSDRSAWLPFGAGPYGCIGVAATFGIVGRALDALRATRVMRIETAGKKTEHGPMLSPGPFYLRLSLR